MANNDNFDDFDFEDDFDYDYQDEGGDVNHEDASSGDEDSAQETIQSSENYDAAAAEDKENEFPSLSDDDKDFVRGEATTPAVSPGSDGNENIIEPLKRGRRKKKGKSGGFMKKALLPLVVTFTVLLCAAAVIFVYSLSTIDKDRVMKNVYIENLNVAGLTYDEALKMVNESKLFEEQSITLSQDGKEFKIDGKDVGLSALPEETTKKAVNYCKDGNVFQNAYNAFMLLFEKHVVMPAPRFDDGLLDEKLKEAGKALVGERVQFYAEYNEENIATVKSGKTGFDDNITDVKNQLMDALHKENFDNIRVDFKTAPPDEMTMANLDALIYKDPVDAHYEYNGNEVSIVEGENGRYIDKDAVAPLIAQIREGCEDVKVPYMPSTPNVNGETLKAKLFANTLSSYATNYGGSTENRKANIARAASLLSGTVIQPGAVFSFNDTVGHRSRDNGFYTAKEYINGESVDGIGGGTCQVSSTLYSAVLYADMGIVERLNHMMSVGYIPLGQDATVSDGGVDFKFKNTSDYPVKISAYTNGSTITITILGTAWEPARKVEIKNNSTTAGENTVVYSTRYVYSNGQLISTDSLSSSTYMPHKAAVSQSASSTQRSSQSYDDDDDEDEDSGSSSNSSSSNSSSSDDEDEDE